MSRTFGLAAYTRHFAASVEQEPPAPEGWKRTRGNGEEDPARHGRGELRHIAGNPKKLSKGTSTQAIDG